MKKAYDLAVKTGEYVKDGETKGRYENVGAVMQGDNGPFIIMKRTFNPAGVPNPEDRDTCVISCFAVDGQKSAPKAAPVDTSEDIPF